MGKHITMINCPACNNEILHDRIIDQVAYCTCGNSFGFGTKRDFNDNVSSAPLIVFGIVLIAAVLHFANWNQHALIILPLKMKQLLHVANESDLVRISQICRERAKLNCEVLALEGAIKLNPANQQYIIRASEIYAQQKNHTATVNSLTTYFKLGGKDFAARHRYAVALGHAGHFREAQAQFRFLLKSSKKNPQFQVARDYVELLLKNHDYANAKSIIESYRGASPHAALFLDKEMKTITAKLSRTAGTSPNKITQKSSRLANAPFDK